MSFGGWLVFAGFWVVFVTTPGPNAVNCIQNGLTFGFRRSMWGVLGILTQASLFLGLSALGVTALVAAAPNVFWWLQFVGALVLIGLGLRTWINATTPPYLGKATAGSIYGQAFIIATVNVKSVAGYVAAFSQFVEPGLSLASLLSVIFPTALTITALSYCTYTAIGAGLGRAALGAVFNVYFRRTMAVLFVSYGVLLMALGQKIGAS